MKKAKDMLRTVCNVGDMWAYLEIEAREDEREIVIAVKAFGLGTPIVEFYSADRYGKALDRFEEIRVEMMKRKKT